MSELRKRYFELMSAGQDISEHLGLLRGLAEDEGVKVIAEIGFRTGVSTNALAMARKTVYSYDIEPSERHRSWFAQHAKHVQIIKANSLETFPPTCDLLHIDGDHTYTQVKAEFAAWSPKVSKWIALHDTATFGVVGRDGKKPGLNQAINEFVEENEDWKILLHLSHNNGMTLLERSTTPSA